MKITGMQIRAFWKGEVGVSGLAEENGSRFRAELEIKDGQILRSRCSCPEGRSYKGLCPHEKALYQQYLRQQEENSRPPVSTSPAVRAMIREYTAKELAEARAGSPEGPVRFRPRLILGREEIRAEFQVGRDRNYVVKDLAAFCRTVEQGASASYGRGEAFSHDPAAFDPASRELVYLVLDMVQTYESYFRQFRRGSLESVPALRQLRMSGSRLDRLLAGMAGESLEAEDIRGIRRTLLVKQEDPELMVQAVREGEDGIRVLLSRRLFCFMGEKRLYAADEETLYCCSESFSQDLGILLCRMAEAYPEPEEVTVSRKDLPLFYQRVLLRAENRGILNTKDVDLEPVRPPALQARFLFESTGPMQVVLHPVLRYGEVEFHPLQTENLPVDLCRDAAGEYRISQVITRYFSHREARTGDPVIAGDEEALFRLADTGIDEFRQLGEVCLAESAQMLQKVAVPAVSVGVRTMGDWLDLSVDLGDLKEEDLYRILEAYRQKKTYYRLKSGEFLKLEDNGLMTVARIAQAAEETGGRHRDRQLRLPRYRAMYLDALYREYGGIRFDRDAMYRSLVRGMKSAEDGEFEIPASLMPVLRGYQRTGFRWLKTLDACGFGGILADDMGLGKTVQAIAVLYDTAMKEPGQTSLIVCPASLVYNWECEIRRFAPSLKVLTAVGTAGEREEKLRHLKEYDVAITSYDLLKRDLEQYREMVFRFQILDEAQYIKNPLTQAARAAKAVRSQTRYALTGTPVENRLSELWSIFDWLMPGFLGSYARFRKRYELPAVRDGNAEAMEDLQRLTRPFLLRRLKTDVLKDLPEKLETTVYSRMDGEQKKLYTASAWKLQEELKEGGRMEILAALTRLRQLCCDPRLLYEGYRGGSAKLETCMELVQSGVEAGHRILLFSQFTSMLDLLKRRLEREKIACFLLTGETSKEERLRLVRAFQKGQAPVFLISLKAGGTGLNLTEADMVIHYDPWWNAAAQEQATDRAYRIGQTRQVSVFKLITRGTIEENIVKLQQSKQALALQAAAGAGVMGTLSREELLELFSQEGL